MLILRRVIKTLATRSDQMSDFKAKMHQIQFQLGLRLKRSLRPPYWI